jgi:Immunoglobulin I-set domain
VKLSEVGFVFFLITGISCSVKGVGSNDDFATAIPLAGSFASGEGQDITDATLEPGEPAHLGGTPCKSLWWSWEAPASGLAWTCACAGSGSVASNVTFAIYTGSRVEALHLVAKGPGQDGFYFNVAGGTTYYIATAVATNVSGEAGLWVENANIFGTPSVPVPGNLLCEGSFEGTGLEFTCWHTDTPVGGHVNDPGGADGSTWPVMNGPVNLWQDFPTVAGGNYAIQFAYSGDGAKLRVKWDATEIAAVAISDAGNYWHWVHLTAMASNTTSRITISNDGPMVGVDAVSVVRMNKKPGIVTPPQPISTLRGGSASFLVGAEGTEPLWYQWFRDGTSLDGRNDKSLLLNPVGDGDAGSYKVVITNAFGAVTSTPVALVVEAPVTPTIVLQPYGDRVAVGGYFALSVGAAGGKPLYYQWFLNDASIDAATNRQLVFGSFQSTNVGTYKVMVSNYAGVVWSLPATLTAREVAGGGLVLMANQYVNGFGTNQFPVFDVDGTTPLSGSDYVAQLYAGETLALLRPVGTPTPFQTGFFNQGFFQSENITLPVVAPGSNAFVQVRAWDATAGASYEEARALGGKFGRSEVFDIVAGGGDLPRALLVGLNSFSLQAGLAQFVAGRITPAGFDDSGTPIWSLQGNAGYRYAIERTLNDFVWDPLMVITNDTGTVRFTDPDPPASGSALYRARILE